MKEPEYQSSKPSWLSELQQKSWEPEILLSGIVLYGMFQAPALIDEFISFSSLNIYGSANNLENFGALLKIALYWLTFGLILHLISRGIWVGMVGLSFTFPKGINKENLKYQEPYQKIVDGLPSMKQIIINLEKVCSSLFSISFMMFMVTIGGYLYFLVTLLLPIFSYIIIFDINGLSDLEQIVINTYALTFFGLGIIGLIDFITLGFLKRIKWISRIYYPVYIVISTLTLARLYRPIYYSLISNFGRWKAGVFLAVFTVASMLMLAKINRTSAMPGESLTLLDIWSDARGVSAYSGYYDDQNDDFHSVRAHIQSDIISENTLRLFVVLKIGTEDSIKSYCNYDSLILEKKAFEVSLECAAKFYQVVLDDELKQDLSWRFFYKQKTDQRGLITYVDISDLPQGNHVVHIKRATDMMDRIYAEIPFYREISATGYVVKPKEEEAEDENYLKLKPVLPK